MAMKNVRQWQMISALFFLFFLGVTGFLLYKPNGFSYLEQGLSALIQPLGQTDTQHVWIAINHLGDFSFCFLLACVIGILFAFFKRGLTGLFFVLGIISLVLIRWVLMRIVEVIPAQISFFPSQQMMVSIFFYGFLMALLGYLFIKNGYKFLIYSLGFGLALLILILGLASLVLEGETFRDQLTGVLLGFSWLSFVIACLHTFKNKGFH